MLFRVRTSLRDRPGALAALAASCGRAGLNILGLQIFPSLGSVTDELVISAPEDWTARAVAELVGGAGGDEVSVEPCTTHDLVDQPVRWLGAAAELVEDPERVDRVVGSLLGEHPEKWSATEHSRAAALTALARRIEESRRPVVRSGEPRPATPATTVDYSTTPGSIEAWIGRHAAGRATFSGDSADRVTIEVDPAWRRLGIGSALLGRACRHAAERGLGEVVLVAPAADTGFVSMLSASGVRARIAVQDGLLSARVDLSNAFRSGREPLDARG